MILVTGAGGQLGTAFRSLLGNRARYLTRADLDLAHPEAIGPVLDELGPSLVLNCAAYTAVDRAESEADQARLVNALAVGALARKAAEVGARFITFSSEYVFDGSSPDPYTESAPTNPLNVYGATKREGELLALAGHPEALVIRTSWLLSGTHPNFVRSMLALDKPARVVDVEWGRPTLADDLARATMAAVERGATGLLHLANRGVTTWYRLAREARELADLDPEWVRPCRREEFPVPARRPPRAVLDSERLDELGLAPMPHYRDGLVRVVKELAAGRPERETSAG